MANSRHELHGVLVVDKPRGLSSHDVVARVRRAAGQKSVGHAGTLDPMASGVLVVLLGEATKLTPWVTADDKAYACTVQLGVATESGDADGTECARAPLDEAIRSGLAVAAEGQPFAALELALAVERERLEQVPPSISAIHVDGERAYDRVRRGEEVVLPPRPVAVRALSTTSVDAASETITCTLHVSKGYYVRAFARDLAASLGTVAHLTMLRRLASGAFLLEDAIPLEELSREAIEARLLPCEVAASRVLPAMHLSTEDVVRARQGKRFPWPSELAHGAHAWLDEAGKLVAVGESREGLACVIRGFFAVAPQSG